MLILTKALKTGEALTGLLQFPGQPASRRLFPNPERKTHKHLEEKHTKLNLLSADPWEKYTRFKSPRMENASPWQSVNLNFHTRKPNRFPSNSSKSSFIQRPRRKSAKSYDWQSIIKSSRLQTPPSADLPLAPSVCHMASTLTASL